MYPVERGRHFKTEAVATGRSLTLQGRVFMNGAERCEDEDEDFYHSLNINGLTGLEYEGVVIGLVASSPFA